MVEPRGTTIRHGLIDVASGTESAFMQWECKSERTLAVHLYRQSLPYPPFNPPETDSRRRQACVNTEYLW